MSGAYASTADLDALAIRALRALAMDMVETANSGHPGAPLALAPLGWWLFRHQMRHDPARLDWCDRDRFVLSCGHASALHYGLLHLAGYDLELSDLQRFRQWDSRTPGHPEYGLTPGVETTTGPLGQGLATAVGMAMAERHLAARFNRPAHTVIDHRCYVIASDGDLMEGVAAEAASLAGHLGLGKLIVYWDDNRITIDGDTGLSISEQTLVRFTSYGWHCSSVADGNDLRAIAAATEAAIHDPRPSLVRVRTTIGFPAPTKGGTSACHGAPLGQDEVARTKALLDWNWAPFTLPEALTAQRQALRARGAQIRQAWQDGLQAYAAAVPGEAAELQRVLAGRRPEGWQDDLPSWPVDGKGTPTRKASGAVLQALAARLPELVGGSADLAGSNNSYLKGLADFAPDPAAARAAVAASESADAGPNAAAQLSDAAASLPAATAAGVPRNVHWGIREHAMAAAINGMALHGGVIPYAATFLIFSDYMRPALRLAALMQLPTRYIFTHDSIGLGEDGPTHQPVEQLACLRAIPGMTVFRPADANETRECWLEALQCPGPAVLALTRQNVPVLDRHRYSDAAGARRGGYVLSEADAAQSRAILIATGSEVALALEAQQALLAEGIAVRVVSMPSLERFAAQDDDYRNTVLPVALRARVVIEAGVRFGWERWAGPEARYVTLEHFGASAPSTVLFERFGFGVGEVVQVVRDLLS